MTTRIGGRDTLQTLALSAMTLVTLLLGLISLVLIGFDTGLVGFLLGFVMATLPVPFYLAFILWIDHFEPEPWWLLALVFLWGAAVASFVALIFNSINAAILTATMGEAGDMMTAVVSAPLVEELAKGIALYLLFFWKRDEFDNVTDGIVYASMVGLGFAMTENVAYYGRAVAEGGVPSAGVLFFLRGIMSPFAHPLFTSMVGIGLGASRESDNAWVKGLAPLAGLFAAIALHAMWNLSASFGALFFVTYAFVMVPAAIAVAVVAFFSVRREARVVRLHLEEIVGEGVL
jgi:RsiW-degrading membrane proteinase PrsW (M82 family)